MCALALLWALSWRGLAGFMYYQMGTAPICCLEIECVPLKRAREHQITYDTNRCCRWILLAQVFMCTKRPSIFLPAVFFSWSDCSKKTGDFMFLDCPYVPFVWLWYLLSLWRSFFRSSASVHSGSVRNWVHGGSEKTFFGRYSWRMTLIHIY